MDKLNNKELVYNNNNGIEYIQFKILLEYNIKHAYTLKGKDTNFRSNSKEEQECYKRICGAIGLDKSTIVKPIQKHTSNVKCIDRIMKRSELKDVDGLITNTRNISLATTNADCILLLFYDPEKQVIANVHSGWRGTFKKISEKTIVKMQTHYRCNPRDIIVCMTPSIRKCHFEVDEDVKKLCENIFAFSGRIDEIISKGDIKEGKQKYYIDSILINKILLTNAGVEEKNIIDSGICSVCSKDIINSYRVEGDDFRLATSIISIS